MAKPEEMTEETLNSPSLKKRLKAIFSLILILALLASSTYLFVWVNDIKKREIEVSKLSLETEQNIQELISGKRATELIYREFNRCQSFITDEQGNFGQFEYCKGFIGWARENFTTISSNKN